MLWYRHIAEDVEESGAETVIYHASIHDTSESPVKTLVVVLTRQTEIYQLKMLENGGVEVTQPKVAVL